MQICLQRPLVALTDDRLSIERQQTDVSMAGLCLEAPRPVTPFLFFYCFLTKKGFYGSIGRPLKVAFESSGVRQWSRGRSSQKL